MYNQIAFILFLTTLVTVSLSELLNDPEKVLQPVQVTARLGQENEANINPRTEGSTENVFASYIQAKQEFAQKSSAETNDKVRTLPALKKEEADVHSQQDSELDKLEERLRNAMLARDPTKPWVNPKRHLYTGNTYRPPWHRNMQTTQQIQSQQQGIAGQDNPTEALSEVQSKNTSSTEKVQLSDGLGLNGDDYSEQRHDDEYIPPQEKLMNSSLSKNVTEDHERIANTPENGLEKLKLTKMGDKNSNSNDSQHKAASEEGQVYSGDEGNSGISDSNQYSSDTMTDTGKKESNGLADTIDDLGDRSSGSNERNQWDRSLMRNPSDKSIGAGKESKEQSSANKSQISRTITSATLLTIAFVVFLVGSYGFRALFGVLFRRFRRQVRRRVFAPKERDVEV